MMLPGPDAPPPTWTAAPLPPITRRGSSSGEKPEAAPGLLASTVTAALTLCMGRVTGPGLI